jgi:2-keto-4-pentenoate hydratase/2-oxohepta-3-ene-1,7-dioic acid hydratase in catechol pathway
VGRNYAEHARELNNEVPTEPLIFLKPSTAANAHKGDILYPEYSKQVDFEAELAVVIGQKCSRVSKKDALRYVFGYTCINDITARDIQKRENKFTHAKSFDTFAPFGPFIETDFNFENVGIRSYVNGELRQNGNTKDMIFDIPTLISFISNIMTLLPGDVIATGTPSGVGSLNVGDTVEVEIEGVGRLVNYVKQRD